MQKLREKSLERDGSSLWTSLDVESHRRDLFNNFFSNWFIADAQVGAVGMEQEARKVLPDERGRGFAADLGRRPAGRSVAADRQGQSVVQLHENLFRCVLLHLISWTIFLIFFFCKILSADEGPDSSCAPAQDVIWDEVLEWFKIYWNNDGYTIQLTGTDTIPKYIGILLREKVFESATGGWCRGGRRWSDDGRNVVQSDVRERVNLARAWL